GPWLGILGTRGVDLGGQFSGTLFEAAVKALEGDVSHVVWFADGSASKSPAFVIEKPSSSAKTLFSGINAAAARQTFHIPSCPVAPKPARADGDAKPKEDVANIPITDAGKIDVVRWSLAGVSIFVVNRADRLSMATGADAALNASCAELPARSTTAKSAMALQVLTQNMHRETQVLPKLLGLGEVIRFDVAVDGSTLRPLGIGGTLDGGHLANAPTDQALLRLFPESTPFVVAANVALPATLDREALTGFYEKNQTALNRQVVVGWKPGGVGGGEVVVAWSRADDLAALKGLFASTMQVETACGYVVMTPDANSLELTRRVCNGKQPSLAHLAKPVVDHLQRDAAVNISVQPGKLLAGLMIDAFGAARKDKALPPEIDDAQRRLEQLPFLGFAGAVSGQILVGAGYRS
ncbi:MAG: hypothetical protein H7Z43_01160, partial [Clostridia bacterium]|nr:hypothetical protein [Deltaproteobacteria bacterium]